MESRTGRVSRQFLLPVRRQSHPLPTRSPLGPSACQSFTPRSGMLALKRTLSDTSDRCVCAWVGWRLCFSGYYNPKLLRRDVMEGMVLCPLRTTPEPWTSFYASDKLFKFYTTPEKRTPDSLHYHLFQPNERVKNVTRKYLLPVPQDFLSANMVSW